MNDQDRQHIAAEAKASPAFGRKLDVMLRQPAGEKMAAISARKAIANQFNPTLYPESRGEWPILRREATKLAEAMPGIVQQIVEKMPFSEKMAAVRLIAQGDSPRMVVASMGDLGQFEIIGSIIGTIAGGAASIYSSSITASAQRDIAAMQADTAIKSAQAQMAIASAQAAIQQAQAVQMTQATASSTPAGFLTQDIGAGIPMWALPAGAGILGIGAMIFFSSRGRRRR
jgi:hypothetical protein